MTTQTRAEANAVGPGRGGRMSRQRKREAVLRLLRGEDLELVSRSLGVTAATLSSWREAFLSAGRASLAIRPTDGEVLESARLKAHLGEMLAGWVLSSHARTASSRLLSLSKGGGAAHRPLGGKAPGPQIAADHRQGQPDPGPPAASTAQTTDRTGRDTPG
jgi:transposase